MTSALATQTRLGELLVDGGAITNEQLIRAIENQRLKGGTLGTCLLELDMLPEVRLLQILSRQLEVEAATPEMLEHIPLPLIDLLPRPVALRRAAIPVWASESEIRIATLDVRDPELLDEIRFSTRRRVIPLVATEVRVFEALERYYGQPCRPRFTRLIERLNEGRMLLAPETSPAAEADDPPSDFVEAPMPSQADRGAEEEPTVPVPTIPPPAPPPDVVVPGSHLAGIEKALSRELNRESIGELMLRYMADKFRRSALFSVRQKHLRGWMARGEDIDRDLFRDLELPLDEPPVLSHLASGGEFYVGPLPGTPAHRRMACAWGGDLPRDCVMMPLRIRGRLACVLYGDGGPNALVGLDIDALRRLSNQASMAFELCILRKKIQ